jgi:hypothetical protein
VKLEYLENQTKSGLEQVLKELRDQHYQRLEKEQDAIKGIIYARALDKDQS